jgi:hypothetical protein
VTRSPALVWLAAAALGLGACREHSTEAPLPAEKLEIASAAPGALGALAGGTDAAPPPPARVPRPTWHVPGDDVEEDPEPEEADAGPEGAPDPTQPTPIEVPL